MTNGEYWGDVFGKEALSMEIMRNWKDEQPTMTLAEFCEHVSRTVWGDDHNEDVNWINIARQIEIDAEQVHPDDFEDW